MAGDEQARLRAELRSARAEVGDWYEVADELDEAAERLRDLLLDVIDAWEPEVLDGQAAARGHAALLEQRVELLRVADEVAADSSTARWQALQVASRADALVTRLARLRDAP